MRLQFTFDKGAPSVAQAQAYTVPSGTGSINISCFGAGGGGSPGNLRWLPDTAITSSSTFTTGDTGLYFIGENPPGWRLCMTLPFNTYNNMKNTDVMEGLRKLLG